MTILVLVVLCGYSQKKEFKFKKYEYRPQIYNEVNYPYPWVFSPLYYHYWEEMRQGDWIEKYKKKYSYQIKEPFIEKVGYLKISAEKIALMFPVAKDKLTEDTLKIFYNYAYDWKYRSEDSLKKYISGLNKTLRKKDYAEQYKGIYDRIGLNKITFSILVFDSEASIKEVEIKELDTVNGAYVVGYFVEYPAWADHFVFNLTTNKWEYVQSVYLENDHDQELYLYQKYAPWYLGQ